jgi:hypothetical protein
MFHESSPAKCRVIQRITDYGVFYCSKPAQASLAIHSPEPIVLCLDCARELAKEIIDSTPGGRRDRRKEGRKCSK